MPRRIDWIRVAHRGLTLFRAMQRDPSLQRDQEREHARAEMLNRSIEDLARQLAGCTRAPDCGCAVCLHGG